MPISAVTGEGIDALEVAIQARLAERRLTVALTLDPSDGAGLSWLYRHAEVLEREFGDDGLMHLTVRADADNAARLRAKFASS